MANLTEDQKIKIGLILNKVNTVLFVAFFIVVCVVGVLPMPIFLTLVGAIFVAFAVCTIISNKFLKNYKPDKKK
ncbi:MAG TPA: hypothetical protein DCR28_02105 [Eubacterium sp.]|nr:hypothetical protein [Eubacterium sp.]